MPHCNILYYCIRAVLSQSHKLCQIGGIAILFFCPPTLYPCGGQRLEQTGWGIKFIQSLPSKQMLPFNICFVLIEFSISMDYSNQKSARIQRECISIYLHAGMILMHCYQPQTQIFQEEHTPKSYGNIVAQAFRQQERKKKKKERNNCYCIIAILTQTKQQQRQEILSILSFIRLPSFYISCRNKTL